MPKNKRLESSESSSESSGPEDKTPPKKAKQEPPAKQSSSSRQSSSSSKGKGSSKDEKEPKFELDKNRFVTVREFRGKVYVDIREFYLDSSGEQKPGKKGISLSTTQWQKLKSIIDDVDSAVSNF